MKHLSVFRLIFLLVCYSFGLNVIAQIRFVPGKFVDGNTNPYKSDESMLENFGFKSVDSTILKKDRLNAMDHILQKRHSVTYLDSINNVQHSEYSRIFSIASNVYSLKNKSFDVPDYLTSIYLGKWVNTVSGFRVGLNLGVLGNNESVEEYIYSGNLSVDYIMSLSNYILDYNQDRRLNLNGYIGLAGGVSFENSQNNGIYFGLRTGLQLTYRLSKGVELFVEPGLNIYSDNYDLTENWRKYDLSPTLMAGVTYRMIPKEYRSESTPFMKGRFMNSFVSLGGGWSNILLKDGVSKSNFTSNIGPSFSVALGKWITPVSGIRASFNMGMPQTYSGKSLSVMSVRADYMLALDPLFEGYNSEKPFKLSLVAGVEAAFPKDNYEAGIPTKYQPNGTAFGLGLGINADFRITDYLSFFVEPRISIYQPKLFGGLSHNKFDLPTNVQVGMTWHPGVEYVRNRFIENSLDSAKVWKDYLYISGAIGVDKLITGDVKEGQSVYSPSASFYIGKRFNSLVGARLGLQAGLPSNHDLNNSRSKYINAGVSADVLLNINTLIYGSNYSTWIDVEPFLGYGANFVNNYSGSWDYISSLRGGLHISKRITRTTKLFIEPHIKLYSDGYNFVNEGGMDFVPGLQAGISYFILPLALRTNVGTFTKNSIWDNTFVTISGGATVLANGATISKNLPNYLSPKLNIGIGKWFNEYSAIRLSGGGELIKSPRDKSDLSQISFHADYMLNINSMFNGYDRSRIFSVSAILGLNGAVPEKYNNNESYSYGLGFGLQGNFKLTRQTEFFIEPRFDLYKSSLWGGFTSSKFDALTSVMMGLTFVRDGEYQSMKTKFDTKDFRPYCYLAFGAGANAALTGNIKSLKEKSVQPYSQISFGYAMTPISSIRLSGNAALLGEMTKKSIYARTKVVALDFDYMFNLSNALFGYSPSRVFSTSPFIGVAAMYNNGETGNGSSSGIFPAFNAGLNFDIAVSPSLSIFLEPKISLTDDKLVTTTFAPLKSDILTSMVLGLKYNLTPIYRDSRVLKMKNESFLDNTFYTFAGYANLVASTKTISRQVAEYVRPGVYIGLGKWFNEYSALRLGLSGSMVNNPNSKGSAKEISMITGSLDYMFNIHSILYGYNPERIFNMYGIIGGAVALPEKSAKTDFTYGAQVGLQGNFNLTDNASIFIEPKAGLFSSDYVGGLSSARFDIPLSLSLGMTFTRKETKDRSAYKFISESIFSNTFISLGAGVNSIVSGHMRVMGKDSFQPIGTLGFGKWFSPISGLRLSGFVGELGELSPKSRNFVKTKLIGFDLDYMMNLTNFVCGYSSDRIFNLSGVLGGSALYNTGLTGNGKNNSIICGVHAGFNASFKLFDELSLYIEPKLGLYDDRLERSSFLPLKADMWGTSTLGLIYNIKGSRYKKSLDSNSISNKSWLYFGYGVGSGIYSKFDDMKIGNTFTIGLESQLTQISTLRFGYKFSKYQVLPSAHYNNTYDLYNGLDINYMMNISNLIAGVNDNRIVNISPFVGASIGATNPDKTMKFVTTLNGGLNIGFKVAQSFDIYIEPRADIGTKHLSQSFNYRPIDLNGCITLGIKYRIK